MMAQFIAGKVVKLMIQKGQAIKGAKALILGITFKENCPDVRNTKVVEIYAELEQFGLDVDLWDPWANQVEVKHKYGIDLIPELMDGEIYDVILLAVAHNEFLRLDFNKFTNDTTVIFDAKAVLSRDIVDARL